MECAIWLRHRSRDIAEASAELASDFVDREPTSSSGLVEGQTGSAVGSGTYFETVGPGGVERPGIVQDQFVYKQGCCRLRYCCLAAGDAAGCCDRASFLEGVWKRTPAMGEHDCVKFKVKLTEKHWDREVNFIRSLFAIKTTINY